MFYNRMDPEWKGTFMFLNDNATDKQRNWKLNNHNLYTYSITATA